MKASELHIFIIAEKTPRTGIIRQFLQEKFYQAKLEIVNVEDFHVEDSISRDLICILDLVNVQEASFRVIARLKKKLPQAKIIAMHIYRSEELVAPLFELGINGYLYSEPSREELTKAIVTVADGENYCQGCGK